MATPTQLISKRGSQTLLHARRLEKVKPFQSTTPDEARLRSKAAYKAWMRFVPQLCHDYQNQLVIIQPRLAREALKRKWVVNRAVSDLRAIDQLCHRAEIELVNTKESWNQSCHVLSSLFNDSVNPRPADFMSKFLSGKD